MLVIGILSFLSTLSVAAAAAESKVDPNVVTCPPADITLSMAGTSAGNALVDAWQKVYSGRFCPGFNVTFQTNSWDAAAARVCDSSLIYDPVDMASMAGSFFQPQANTEDGWGFQCLRSKGARQTILLHVANKGVALEVSKHGPADKCLELLGGGLSHDQLRWIFSGFSTKQLVSNGWDPASVPFLDGDDSTHLWSELNENCTNTEILIAAPEEDLGTGGASDYFFEHILSSRGEQMREYFGGATWDDLAMYLNANDDAIAFNHLSDMLSKSFQDENLIAVAIEDDDGNMVLPTSKTFESGAYPFLQKVYIGLVNDPAALNFTRPFLEFGFSAEGEQVLLDLGYWPLREWEKLVMYTRVGSQLGLNIEELRAQCGPSNGHITMAGSDAVLPVLELWSEIYKIACPMDIGLEGGGSNAGAYRSCASTESGDSVDIGLMSRDFDPKEEAAPRQGKKFVYDCIEEEGDKMAKSVIQIDVALDGMSVVFPIGGMGEHCVRLLGGLTMDQLRWMYSSYNDLELQQSGWDPNCLKNNDYDLNTHKWSELDSRCADEEIQLSGDFWNDGSFTSFSKLVLPDYNKGEHISDTRPKAYVEIIGFDALNYLLEHDDAVTYVGYVFYFEHQDVYWAAPLARTPFEAFVTPSEKTIGDGSYPLVRSVFVNLYNNPDSLRDSKPLIKFGLSHPELISSNGGYVPIVGKQRDEMYDRLSGAPYATSVDTTQEEESKNTVAIAVGSMAVVVVVAIVAVVAYPYLRRRYFSSK